MCLEGHLIRRNREGQEVLSKFPGETIGKEGENSTRGSKVYAPVDGVWAICEVWIFLNKVEPKSQKPQEKVTKPSSVQQSGIEMNTGNYPELGAEIHFPLLFSNFFTVENFK